MQLIAPSTVTAAPVAPTSSPTHAPQLPAIDFRAVKMQHFPQGVVPGWSTPDDRPWMNGGSLVSVQRPVEGSIARAQRWFGTFYGAFTRTQVILGARVASLGAYADESQALRAALELTTKPGAPSVALVKDGADWVLRATLAPVIHSPYETGMHSDKANNRPVAWGAFRVTNQQDDTSGGWDDTGYAEAVKFTSSAVRAIIDGAKVFRNRS